MNRARKLLQKAVDVRPGEVRALLLACAFNFIILASYYVVRPIRDDIGAAGGVEKLPWMYTGPLVTMLVANAAFSAIASPLTLYDIVRRYQMRTIVDLPSEQVRKLALVCRKEKISRAEAVRRAVEHWLKGTANGGLQDYFGASKTRGNVSKHLAQIRREWAGRN